RKKVVDNFIHSVVKVEDELRHNWVDSRLTLACREGFTMVYDEFNRSRPEVNNVLLSALEEKLLVLPPSGNRPEYIRVSPHFRAIFTSNPEEYCGVHGTQDALLDRVITINMPEPDELTQQQILVQKVGIDSAAALLVVRIVRALQASVETDMVSSLRPSLMIATICLQHDIPILAENPDFRDVCSDILLTRSGLPPAEATQLMWGIFNDFIVAQATAAPAIVDLNAIVGEAKLSGEGVEAQPEEYIQDVEVEDRTSSAIAVTAKDAALPDSESPTTEVDIQDAVKSDSVADTIPHQAEVLDFLMQRESARLVEIENALSLNRFQVVNILRSLIDAGLITKQESAGKPSIYTFEAAQTPE
ncbi:MAG: AAA family ATPase, partial [Cyanobacteria bacterium J06659_2]